MAKLKIKIYKNNGTSPSQTINIPLGIIGIAMKFVPRKMKETLEAKGLDVKMLADVAKSGEVQGEVAVIENHEKNEKTVISIE